jgi:hypothetical protein
VGSSKNKHAASKVGGSRAGQTAWHKTPDMGAGMESSKERTGHAKNSIAIGLC